MQEGRIFTVSMSTRKIMVSRKPHGLKKNILPKFCVKQDMEKEEKRLKPFKINLRETYLRV